MKINIYLHIYLFCLLYQLFIFQLFFVSSFYENKQYKRPMKIKVHREL